jgi:hypothetical protein
MAVRALISPPLSDQTPLGSLSGWALIVHCGQCGERSKLVDKIATTPSIYARPIGQMVARFTCSGCGAHPVKLEAECVWAARVLPPHTRIDLSWLLPKAPPPKDQLQASLF